MWEAEGVFNLIQTGVETVVADYDIESILNKTSLRDHLALIYICVCVCVSPTITLECLN
jgi:hypothetical protein